jgi:DNA invertase Pin-like site-specific DNA recombinase
LAQFKPRKPLTFAVEARCIKNERLSNNMFIGYMRVSKSDGSQTVDLQRYALIAAGVDPTQIYEDRASGRLDARPGLEATLKALRPGDALLVWKLDRLGRNLRHLVLVNTVHELATRGVGFKVLTGHGASIETTTAAGKMVFGIFAASPNSNVS